MDNFQCGLVNFRSGLAKSKRGLDNGWSEASK